MAQPAQHLERGEHVNPGEGADPEKLMKFKKAKCRVLHLSQDRMDGGIESSPSEKNLGDKLGVIWPCALPVWKASCVLGSSPAVWAAGEGEILPSHKIPTLEQCIQLWSLQHKTHMDRAGLEESMELL